jgi:hypothetical protein
MYIQQSSVSNARSLRNRLMAAEFDSAFFPKGEGAVSKATDGYAPLSVDPSIH